jgi:hypothetical protein
MPISSRQQKIHIQVHTLIINSVVHGEWFKRTGDYHQLCILDIFKLLTAIKKQTLKYDRKSTGMKISPVFIMCTHNTK